MVKDQVAKSNVFSKKRSHPRYGIRTSHQINNQSNKHKQISSFSNLLAIYPMVDLAFNLKGVQQYALPKVCILYMSMLYMWPHIFIYIYIICSMHTYLYIYIHVCMMHRISYAAAVVVVVVCVTCFSSFPTC